MRQITTYINLSQLIAQSIVYFLPGDMKILKKCQYGYIEVVATALLDVRGKIIAGTGALACQNFCTSLYYELLPFVTAAQCRRLFVFILRIPYPLHICRCAIIGLRFVPQIGSVFPFLTDVGKADFLKLLNIYA